MKKKILHIINGEYYSGAERVQDLLAINLPYFNYEVHFVCVKPQMFKQHCSCAKSLVVNFPMSGKFDMKTVRRIAEYAREIDAIIIHSHTPRTALVSAMVQFYTRLPRVHHVHSPTSRDTDNTLRNLLNTVVERLSVVGVRQFITVSESLADWLSTIAISPSKVTVVPNGVPQVSVASRENLGDSVVLGVVALFRPRKGLDVLLRALHEVKKTDTAVHLRVVGGFETPAYEKEIKSLNESLGLADSVTWVGFTDDVTSELAKMDVFVLPSVFGEGMPMVLLEAMAVGLPVIGTDVEGIPEVARDGLEGFIVEPSNVQVMAKVIQVLSRDSELRQKMGKASRQRHERFYSDRVMAEKVCEVYSSVLRGE